MHVPASKTAFLLGAFPRRACVVILSLAGLTGCAEGFGEEPKSPASLANEARHDGALGGLDTWREPVSPPAAPDEQVLADEARADDQDPAVLERFKPVLAPHGEWAEDPTYGVVWTPSAAIVGNDFAPYVTAGHWTHDGMSYVWVSDYDWGWAPFHYGRWTYIGGRGWAWIPGRRYAGAWVAWRVGPTGYGYVGWAPLAPRWGWRSGRAFAYAAVPPQPYAFCRTDRLFERRVPVVGRGELGAIAGATRPWTPAQPEVGGRVIASPTIDGPPPRDLGWRGEAPSPPPQRALAVASPRIAPSPGPTPLPARFGQFEAARPLVAPAPTTAYRTPDILPAPQRSPPTTWMQGSTPDSPPTVFTPAPRVTYAPTPRFAPSTRVTEAPGRAYAPSPSFAAPSYTPAPRVSFGPSAGSTFARPSPSPSGGFRSITPSPSRSFAAPSVGGGGRSGFTAAPRFSATPSIRGR